MKFIIIILSLLISAASLAQVTTCLILEQGLTIYDFKKDQKIYSLTFNRHLQRASGGKEKNAGVGGYAGGSHGFSLDLFFGSFLLDQAKRNEHVPGKRCEAPNFLRWQYIRWLSQLFIV